MQWDEPELTAFADQAELLLVEVDVVPGERGGLAQPQPRKREQMERQLLAFGPNRRVDVAELSVAVGDGLQVRQPRQPHVAGRVMADEAVPLPVPVGGAQIGELPSDCRERPPVEELVEVLLALKQRQLTRRDPVRVEPALSRPQRLRRGFDRQRGAPAAPLRSQERLENRIHSEAVLSGRGQRPAHTMQRQHEHTPGCAGSDERPPHPANSCVHRVRSRTRRTPPHHRDQLVLPEHPKRVSGHHHQKPVLQRRQLELDLAEPLPPPHRIDTQTTNHQTPSPRRNSRERRRRTDRGRQRPPRETRRLLRPRPPLPTLTPANQTGKPNQRLVQPATKQMQLTHQHPLDRKRHRHAHTHPRITHARHLPSEPARDSMRATGTMGLIRA